MHVWTFSQKKGTRLINEKRAEKCEKGAWQAESITELARYEQQPERQGPQRQFVVLFDNSLKHTFVLSLL